VTGVGEARRTFEKSSGAPPDYDSDGRKDSPKKTTLEMGRNQMGNPDSG